MEGMTLFLLGLLVTGPLPVTWPPTESPDAVSISPRHPRAPVDTHKHTHTHKKKKKKLQEQSRKLNQAPLKHSQILQSLLTCRQNLCQSSCPFVRKKWNISEHSFTTNYTVMLPATYSFILFPYSLKFLNNQPRDYLFCSEGPRATDGRRKEQFPAVEDKFLNTFIKDDKTSFFLFVIQGHHWWRIVAWSISETNFLRCSADTLIITLNSFVVVSRVSCDSSGSQPIIFTTTTSTRLKKYFAF